VAHTAAPALDTNDVVALVDDAKLDAVRNAPLETAVDVLLPDLDVEVWLLLREEEWIDATIEVGILHYQSAHVVRIRKTNLLVKQSGYE